METQKILGIDLGTNSLGWSVLEQQKNKFKLLDKGIVLFDEGVIIEKGNEKSKAAERTVYRSARRLIFRRKLRKYETLKVLAKHQMVPLSLEEVNAWRKSNFTGYPKNDVFFEWLRTDDKINKNPYYLRAKAVNEKLNKQDLGRIFYHLAQRRGFLSNRLEKAKNEKETGVVKENIAAITKKIEEAGAKSLGEYFWQLYQKDRSAPENKIRKQYLGRKEHYLKEFELICQTQELPEQLCLALKKAIFYQRPLKSQKGLVGKCVFEPRKNRMPVSHPTFEAFRMWSFINNIKIQTPYDEDMRFLTDFEKQKIIPLFETSTSTKHFKFEKIAKKLVSPEFKKPKLAYYKSKEAKSAHYLFNYDLKTSVSGSPVTALFKKYLGNDWAERIFTYEVTKPNGQKVKKTADFQDIWHVLFTFEDDDKIREYFTKKLGLDEETAGKFVEFNLPQGYASISFKAARKILNFLIEGFTYDKAVILARIPDIVGMEIWDIAENRQNIIDKVQEIFERNSVKQKIDRSVNKTIFDLHQNKITNTLAYENILRSNIYNVFGKKSFEKIPDNDQLFQIAFQLLQERLQFKKLEEQFIQQQTIEEQVKNYLKETFNVSEKELKLLYHPSMTDIYPKPPVAQDGKRYLGSPIINSIKNPVMMRAMHLLRRLVNELLRKNTIDNETVVHIELARDLNDTNVRAAIKRYQREREKENQQYSEEIKKTFLENGINREPNAEDIRRYRLWKEQGEISIYTGETIPLHLLFDGTRYDFEHTVPRSQSYDNSLANLTIAESYVNREVKKNKLPSELDNFEEIQQRLEPWKEKIKKLENEIDKEITRTRMSVTKEEKDRHIQNRHYLKMQKDYWEKKVKNFELTEINDSFKYSQLNDTRLITKYARAYLKSVFPVVHVVTGNMTAEFRKLWGVQEKDEKKSRSNHIHHAVDATVIAAITRNAYNKLAEAWRKRENDLEKEAKKLIEESKPWDTFTEDVLNLHKDTFVYHDFKDNLPKHTKKKKRKRGVIEYRPVKTLPEWFQRLADKGIYKPGRDYKIIEKNGEVSYEIPKYLEGDTARGVLHRESVYGAIAQKDDKGHIIKDKNGDIQVDYVIRKAVEDLSMSDAEKIVDPVVRKIVLNDLKRKAELIKKKDNINKALRNTTEEKEAELLKEKEQLETELTKLFRLPTKKGDFIPIRKVRIKTRVKEPLPEFKKHRDLSSKPYKQWIHVENKENYALAFYEGIDKKGQLQRDYEIIKNIEAATYFKRSNYQYRQNHELVPETKKGLPLKYILKKGMSIMFYENTPEELKDLSNEELVKRLYVITQIRKDGNIYFIPNQLAGEISDLKKNAKSKIILENSMLLLSRKNWNFIVNEKEFIMDIDGKIHFRF